MSIVLDLFCGAGGATRGYQLAGHTVYGVDIAPQPRYCGDGFEQGDALVAIRHLYHGRGIAFSHGPSATLIRLDDIDFIHASPPCQAANPLTTGTNAGMYDHPQLIPETRLELSCINRPYIIENTAGAPIRKDLTLNGDMFGLDVWRPRWFEYGGGFTCIQPDGPRKPLRGRVRGWRHGEWFDGPYVAVYGKGGGKASVTEAQEAMGIDWTDDWHELTEAIPPAYTRHIGGFIK